ncbi:hypothetical protein Tco_0226813 [Tanacetum coccineum]
MIIKKDSEIVKAKGERKSLALKAKKESSDREYAVIQIILLENVQNHRKTRTKERSSEVLGVIAVRKMMKRIKTKHVYAQASNERTVREVEQEYEPTSAKEKKDRRNEMKARGTLFMALPNKDQLKFHSYKDAKLLLEAIEKRYGGNKESKKVKRTLLKQQHENFSGSSLEIMDQTFDRSLPSEWKTHALIWRNKEEIETISLDDLYNNLKIYEPELAGSANTSQNSQNVAFMSSNSTNNNINSNNIINEADNTAYGDLKQIDPDDLEEMDLQWEKVMLTIRATRFIKRTGKKLYVNGQRVRFDRGRENNKRTVTVETPIENALVAQDRIEGYDWSYQAEEEHPTNYTLMAFTSLGSSSSSDSDVDSCSKSCVKAYATLKE